MKTELNYFSVSPKVVKADRKTKVKIKYLFDQVKFPDADKLKVRYTARDIKSTNGGHCTLEDLIDELTEVPFSISDNTLSIEIYFADEQEHTIQLEYCDKKVSRIFNFRLYSLKEDLLASALRLYNNTKNIGILHSQT